MKKNILLIMLLQMIVIEQYAQNASVSTIDFNYKKQQAVTAEYQMSGAVTENALKQKMLEQKCKGGSKNKEGYIIYQGVILPEITADKMDVYFKIDDKKTSSTLTMLNSKGYENFMNTTVDSAVFEKSIGFMNSLNKVVMGHGYNEEIISLEKNMKNLEKDLKKSEKNGTGYEKDKMKAESKLAEINNEIGTLKTDLENQQKTLAFVKAKTGTVDQMKAIKKEIDKQEDEVKNANKKYENALDNTEEAKKDIEKSTKNISDNTAEQKKIKEDIDGIKLKISELKAKIGALN